MLYAITKNLVLPVGILPITGILALLLSRYWPRAAYFFLALVLCTSFMLALPWTASELALLRETHPPLNIDSVDIPSDAVIVVLGGGADWNAPEYDRRDTVSRLTLERLRFGAYLHRRLKLPLAVSGGSPESGMTSEASMMSDVLINEFRVAVKYRETRSRNTAENARYMRATLGDRTIVLVTHSIHMRRAVTAFADTGSRVIPAPMGFFSSDDGDYAWHAFVPQSESFAQSNYAIYEMLGELWYALSDAKTNRQLANSANAG